MGNRPETDRKRWVFELLQSAKDSIVGDETRKQVDVTLIKEDNCVIFRHNGSPFTEETRLGLARKVSEGKENTESTG